MSWEDMGIKDPNLKWNNFGSYQDWNSNTLSDLFEKTYEEIEDCQLYLYDILTLDIYPKQVDNLIDWIDYIECLLDEASFDVDTRNKLIDVRIQLSKFKKYFYNFIIQIESLGDTNEINDN